MTVETETVTSAEILDPLGRLDGGTGVRPHPVLSPPWTPERLSEDARFAPGL